jgi:hypothetical protein
MDMQHIIIELLSGFAERVVFTGLLIALTPLEGDRVLDGTPTMWYISV